MPRSQTSSASTTARRQRLALEKAALDEYFAHSGKLSIRAIAARHPGVNRTTLARRINGTHRPHDVAFQHLQRLRPEQEQALHERVAGLIDRGDAPDIGTLTELANEELLRGVEAHGDDDDADADDDDDDARGHAEDRPPVPELGQCWGRNFLRRHPDLEVRRKLKQFHQAEATAVQTAMGELARAYYEATRRADLLEQKNRELVARLEQLGDRRGGRPLGSGSVDPQRRRGLEAEKRSAYEERRRAQAALAGMDRSADGYDEAARALHIAKDRHMQACKVLNEFLTAQDHAPEAETSGSFPEHSPEDSRTDPALAMQGVMRF